jgi:hypothetical protein
MSEQKYSISFGSITTGVTSPSVSSGTHPAMLQYNSAYISCKEFTVEYGAKREWCWIEGVDEVVLSTVNKIPARRHTHSSCKLDYGACCKYCVEKIQVHDCGRNRIERQSKQESFVHNFGSDGRNTERELPLMTLWGKRTLLIWTQKT